tara:strand:- start:6849 stop:7775 length:927 start_codon:yes stop_codon:yes gene_type:complete
MARKIKDYIFIGLKGLGMGAADVVPGVSGGTIAFISGIYEEFITSLKSIDLNALQLLFKEGIGAFWKKINGNFLVALFAGIFVSILSLAKLITFLLEEYPVQLWSFFFGLIVASCITIGAKIRKWNAGTIIALIAGTAIAYYITIAAPAETSESLGFVFLSGAIAICAMILPGISGSFILLLMGKYRFILDSISAFDIKVLVTFALGCATGLISFSHLLSWMFKRFHDLTVALLTGFMIGSLNKVWPWKITTQFRTNSHGEEVPFLQESVLPMDFPGESYVVWAIALMVLGFLLIASLERVNRKRSQV